MTEPNVDPRSRDTLAVLNAVCRRWRVLAVSSSGLWTEIRSSFSPEKAALYLQRSDPSALTIHISRFPQDLTRQANVSLGRVLDLIHEALPRVKYLGVPVSPRQTFAHPIFATSAPALEFLSLRRNSRGVSKIQVEGFLGRHTPALRHLRLHGTLVPWNSPLLRNLTSIHLSKLDANSQPTENELAIVLLCCPQIEDLQLKNAGPVFPDLTLDREPARAHSSTITLPYMRRCSFAYDLSPLPTPFSDHCFLRLLDAPSLEFLSLSHVRGDIPRVDIVELLPSQFRPFKSESFSSISFTYPIRTKMKILWSFNDATARRFAFVCEEHIIGWSGREIPRIPIQDPIGVWSIGDLLPSCLYNWNSSSITEICISLDCSERYRSPNRNANPSFRNVARDLVNLERLQIIGNNNSDEVETVTLILRELSCLQNAPSPAEQKGIHILLTPSLAELELTAVFVNSDVYGALTLLLRERKLHHDHPIGRVKCTGCRGAGRFVIVLSTLTQVDVFEVSRSCHLLTDI